MPLWVSDFLGDTMDLDATEIGAYMLLLMAQWNRDGGSLPNDSEKLKRICRCGRGWPKVWGVLERFFQTDEQGVYSKRLRLEATSVALKREVNSHNGSRGGNAKALKNNNAGMANANHSLERNSKRNDGISEPEPDIEKEEGKPSSKKTRSSRLPSEWFLPIDWGQWAVSEGLPIEAIRSEADRFKDYYHALAGPKAVKADWQATWRNWIRNSKARQPQLTAINGGRSDKPTRQQFDTAHREYARRLSAGEIRIPDPSNPFAQ